MTEHSSPSFEAHTKLPMLAIVPSHCQRFLYGFPVTTPYTTTVTHSRISLPQKGLEEEACTSIARTPASHQTTLYDQAQDDKQREYLSRLKVEVSVKLLCTERIA